LITHLSGHQRGERGRKEQERTSGWNIDRGEGERKTECERKIDVKGRYNIL
jgi:hypothetical protein